MYRLTFNPVDISYLFKKDDGTVIQQNIPFSFFKALEKEVVKKDKTYKLFYKVKFSDHVKENLTGMFLLTNRGEFAKLTGSVAQQALYFYLISLKNAFTNKPESERIGDPSFDELAKHCQALDQEPKRIKALINRAFKAIQELSPLDEWDEGPAPQTPRDKKAFLSL